MSGRIDGRKDEETSGQIDLGLGKGPGSSFAQISFRNITQLFHTKRYKNLASEVKCM